MINNEISPKNNIFNRFWNRIRKKPEPIVPQISEDTKTDLPYFSLAPSLHPEENKHYVEALNWSMANRKDKGIYNIAVTGPYGSGKSSVLKAFIDSNDENGLRILHISLASFKEDPTIKNGPKPSASDKETMLRLIELSILQQFFYHEDDEMIPDSHFKKSRGISESSITELTATFIAFTAALTYEVFPEVFWDISRLPYLYILDIILHSFSLSILICVGYWIIKSVIRPIRSLNFTKFNVQNAEFTLEKKIAKSFLNEHLDELIYFFQETKYDVVIFEDLDRFQQTEIFTKLRELNHIINYSHKIATHVVFIYAVRDDMFVDKDRTKFFDFILPVIPVINGSNSNVKLLQLKNGLGYNLKQDLLDDIAYYVEDMRLLLNIMNEFYIYKKTLQQESSEDMLLALITYKNLYPKDFSDLCVQSGDLYKIIESKGDHIKKRMSELEKQTDELDTYRSLIKAQKLKNVEELRKLYLLEFYRIKGFRNFRHRGVVVQLDDMLRDEQFSLLMANEILQATDANPAPHSTTTFEEIEKKVDPIHTYVERVDFIENNSTEETIKLEQQVNEIVAEIEKLQHLKIKELIESGSFSTTIKNERQSRLIRTMLKSGYINENYINYVSIFYPGLLEREDQEFLMNVRAGIKTPYQYKLKNVEVLIEKIQPNEFQLPYVLNYDLVDMLLTGMRWHDRRDYLLKMLIGNQGMAHQFLYGYIFSFKAKQGGEFLQSLVDYFPDIWKGSVKSMRNPKDGIQLFLMFAKFIETAKLKRLNEDGEFSLYIADVKEFLTSDIDEEKKVEIIQTLKVRFVDVDFELTSPELINFILKGGYYMFSVEIFKKILQYHRIKIKPSFSLSNYDYMQTINVPYMAQHIDSRLYGYVHNVWLKLPGNSVESNHSILKLLLSDQLTFELKLGVVEKLAVKIDEIHYLKRNIADMVLNNGKVKPTWANVIWYHEQSGNIFSLELIKYLNLEENYRVLGKTKIRDDEPKKGPLNLRDFMHQLLQLDDLTTDSYREISKAVRLKFDKLTVDTVSRDKVEILVNSRKVFNVTPENFKYLKDDYGLFYVDLIESNPKLFAKYHQDFSLAMDDYAEIVASGRFTDLQKITILNGLTIEDLTSSSRLRNQLGIFATNNSQYDLDHALMVKIVKSNMTQEQRVALFNAKFHEFSEEEILSIFKSWNYPYKDLAEKGKRPPIPNTPHNRNFVEKIQGLSWIGKISPEEKVIKVATKKNI